jgi:8-oxo-dGTP diphosphatase
VLDWAPHPNEGDKLLVIFDGGTVDARWIDRLVRQEEEVATIAWHPVAALDDLMPARLARRVAHAASADPIVYLEHGSPS